MGNPYVDSELENEQLPISFPLTKYTRKVEYNWSEYQFILTYNESLYLVERNIFYNILIEFGIHC
jgi:hypothetical protein